MLPGKLTGSKTSADIDAAAKSGTMMSCRSQKMRASTIKLADVDKEDKTDETQRPPLKGHPGRTLGGQPEPLICETCLQFRGSNGPSPVRSP